jgi:hypothetical protein
MAFACGSALLFARMRIETRRRPRYERAVDFGKHDS